MNALDSLFDFAALMSTSSAMTAPQHPKNDTLVSALDTQSSNAHPSSIPSTQSSQPQGRMQQPSQQQSGGIHSLPQTENDIAMFSRAYADSGTQDPIDWIPAPALLQQISRQEHDRFILDESCLGICDAPFPNCRDVDCSHRPSHPDCNYSLPLSRHYKQGSVMPNARNDWHILPGQYERELQHFQRMQADMLLGEGHMLGQQLTPHDFCIEDSYEPIARRSMALQYGTVGMGMHPENRASFEQYY